MFNCWCCYCCCCCQYTQNIFDIRERCLSNRKSVQSIMRGIKFDSTFLYNALFCFFVPPFVCLRLSTFDLAHLRSLYLLFNNPFFALLSLSLLLSTFLIFSIFLPISRQSSLSLSLSLSFSFYIHSSKVLEA